MMDLTWYLLGILSGIVIYVVYMLSQKFVSNWFTWSGFSCGIVLILFSIAWGVGAVLEGVPQAGSMGILLFGLPGLILLTITIRKIVSQKEITK